MLRRTNGRFLGLLSLVMVLLSVFMYYQLAKPKRWQMTEVLQLHIIKLFMNS